LAGSISPLEDDDDAQSLVFDPFLQEAQLRLESAKLLLVRLRLQLSLAEIGFLLCHRCLWSTCRLLSAVPRHGFGVAAAVAVGDCQVGLWMFHPPPSAL